MISESELLFQLGTIMLLAFIAATMARKLNQTVMIGYILIGVFIGPKISISVFGIDYHGLISDTTMVDLLSNVGLVMLMFFVGLEFSFTKLKKVRTPALILAIIDVSVGLFVGFVFASYLGWPLIDSIFLAGVIAMSSTSIAMKVLFDLKRMSSPEVEFLIGLVVVETFIAMIILAIASGMIINPGASAMGYGRLFLGMGAFYAFFVWVAMWAVPRVVAFFEKIDNDELFILFALGIVFLTAGMASLMNVPPIIGAFFIGMTLAESKVTIRIQTKLESFKDAFVAVFFTAFGMMIDPAMFGSVIWMVLLAIPLVILYEAFVMSSISMFLGFSPRGSTAIGTSMCGRGVESILYANVGSRVQGASMGALLNPFAGAFCFAMSAITPMLVKYSSKLADGLSRIIPRPVKFSGAVMSRTLGRIVMPSSSKLFRGAKLSGALLVSFVAICFAALVTAATLQTIIVVAGALVALGIFLAIRREMSYAVKHIDYADLGVGAIDKKPVVTLVSGVIFGAVIAALVIAYTWEVMWQLSVVVSIGYVIFVVGLMLWACRRLYVEGTDIPNREFAVPRSILVSQIDSEVVPQVPAPAYSLVRMPLDENRLFAASTPSPVIPYPLAHDDEVSPPPVLSQIALRKEPELHVEPEGGDESG
jgi:CPA2 family monovalent cation:H+ antiporter-2